MTQTLRQSILKMLFVSAALFVLVFISATFVFAQTTSTANSTETSQQLARSLGSYAIIPPGSSSASQISGAADRTEDRSRNAPHRENLQAIKMAGGHINALIGGFDQGAGFGFGVEFSTADSIPGVVLRAKILTSTRLYRRLEGEAYIPKLFSEKTHASIWFNDLYRSRDNFFNIGPRSPQTPETNYGVEERSYNVSLFHDIRKGAQVGVYGRVSNASAYRGKDENDIPVDTLFSGRPTTSPITRFLPGLNNNVKLFSYGVFGEFDFRNNEHGLTQGVYAYVRLASNEGLKNEAFSDFGWNEVELDGRAYIPLGTDSSSLALRAFTELNNPKRGSQIPFYEQAYFGGRSHGRGFRNFRFRGNNSLLLSVEPRQTVWKQKETRGLDVFVFGDFGQVWGDNRSTVNPLVLANDKFDSANWRAGAGLGFQYRVNKSVAIRLDYGRTNERSMTYFSVSRGF